MFHAQHIKIVSYVWFFLVHCNNNTQFERKIFICFIQKHNFTYNPCIKIWHTTQNLIKNIFTFSYFYKYFLEQRLFTTPLCSININTSVCFITIIFSPLMRCGESKIDIIILFIQNGFLAVHWKRICLTRKVQ